MPSVTMFSLPLLYLFAVGVSTAWSAPADQVIRLDAEHTVVLNTVVDALITKAKETMHAAGKDTIHIPDFNLTFSKGWKYMHITGEFHGTKGWLGKLTSMERTGDAVLETADKGLKLTARLGLKDLRVGFDSYTARFALTHLKGQTEAKIGDNSVHVEILLHYDDNSCSAELKSVEIEKVGNIDISIKGGWRFANWFYRKAASFIANHAKDSLRKEVTERLTVDFKKALVKYDICKDIPQEK